MVVKVHPSSLRSSNKIMMVYGNDVNHFYDWVIWKTWCIIYYNVKFETNEKSLISYSNSERN